ncbi:Protein dip1 [Psilocybe cubensis]|uniref:Protein dip1 n=2 Tax=Psilocybe cubensis TaxID=181762 RepID=A0ACB8GHV6_PSICU|nr:Protein dip1 [Psilocybe cubensis]KAH9474650.1 Protein dip1 [Psilocybe cubensis]
MSHIAHTDSYKATMRTMEDDLGIVYLIESAQQFWSELDDTLQLAEDEPPTLSMLDTTLRRFMALCATYHEQYLQSPLQLEHACGMLAGSELFEFHSERMLDIIVDDARTITDPHSAFIYYSILFYYGHHRSDFFRSHKRWQPLLPLLMDHVLVEVDPDIDDTYVGTAVGKSSSFSAVPIPIEAKLRSLCVKLLYEVCRVQTLSAQDLKIFDEFFIDHLFDLVEQTKYMHDDTFNYSVIRLIIALNEQFMVAGLGNDGSPIGDKRDAQEPKNRVIRVMMRRLGSCKTFGENLIFMLNRTKHTPEDFCVKLLILKILYVLFSSKGTAEFFYTNDLCVLVDVFLRELADLDEEDESLRHTYLRVLHPLLTKTQLREVEYKRPQILVTLESMIVNSRMREVSPTTKRLVERCLSGPWCTSLRESRKASDNDDRAGSPQSEGSTLMSPPGYMGNISMAVSQRHSDSSGSAKVMMSMKYSKSVENLSGRLDQPKQPLRSPLDQVRRPSNASVQSLPGAMASAKATAATHTKKRSTSTAPDAAHHPSRHNSLDPDYQKHPYSAQSPPQSPSRSHHLSAPPVPTVPLVTSEGIPVLVQPRRRPPPPAPPKRRKPPAIPISHINNGVTITAIRSSEPSPLSKVHKPPLGVQQAS